MAALRRHAAPAHLRVLGPRVGGDAHARARRDRAMGYSEPEWSGLWPAARDRGRPRRNRLRPRAGPGAARGQDSPATGFELLTRGTGSGARAALKGVPVKTLSDRVRELLEPGSGFAGRFAARFASGNARAAAAQPVTVAGAAEPGA